MFTLIDRKAIEVAEVISHKLQLLTGKNNFFLARTVTKIGLCFPVLFVVSKLATTEKELSVISCITILLTAAFYSLILYYTHGAALLDSKNESIAFNNLEQRISNPEKIDSSSIMIRKWSLITFVVFRFSSLYLYEFGWMSVHDVWLLLWIGWVLNACDPLPPGESKVKQWLTSLKTSFSLKPISEVS